MQRVFTREKKCTEEIQVNGIIRSLQMHPKKYPHYVGTEAVDFLLCSSFLN